ncbi:unnamed protein product [Polarella glacialis]|uniref:Cyclic nucleotide-binding domain-containing protein n=1 Tax=Polarella glacialis TaxID=89957 RepID=A0A813G492_POLGL|nr:unnamed protein product [Polarella glacialis]
MASTETAEAGEAPAGSKLLSPSNKANNSNNSNNSIALRNAPRVAKLGVLAIIAPRMRRLSALAVVSARARSNSNSSNNNNNKSVIRKLSGLAPVFSDKDPKYNNNNNKNNKQEVQFAEADSSLPNPTSPSGPENHPLRARRKLGTQRWKGNAFLGDLSPTTAAPDFPAEAVDPAENSDSDDDDDEEVEEFVSAMLRVFESGTVRDMRSLAPELTRVDPWWRAHVEEAQIHHNSRRSNIRVLPKSGEKPSRLSQFDPNPNDLAQLWGELSTPGPWHPLADPELDASPKDDSAGQKRKRKKKWGGGAGGATSSATEIQCGDRRCLHYLRVVTELQLERQRVTFALRAVPSSRPGEPHARSEEQLQLLVKLVETQPELANLPRPLLKQVAGAATYLSVAPGQILRVVRVKWGIVFSACVIEGKVVVHKKVHDVEELAEEALLLPKAPLRSKSQPISLATALKRVNFGAPQVEVEVEGPAEQGQAEFDRADADFDGDCAEAEHPLRRNYHGHDRADGDEQDCSCAEAADVGLGADARKVRLGVGAAFGARSLLKREARTASVLTLEPTKLMVVTREDYGLLIRSAQAAETRENTDIRPRGKGKGKGKQPYLEPPEKRRRVESRGREQSRDIVGLVKATAELSLQTARNSRIHSGMALTTILVPESPSISAGLAVESVSQPLLTDLHRWARLVLALSQDEKVSAQHRTVLLEHAQATASIDALLGQVLSCSIVPTFADTKIIKIQFAVASVIQTTAAAVIGALVDLGGEAKFGPPPRTSAERAESYVRGLERHMETTAGAPE